MADEKTQKLAEKIALLLRENENGSDYFLRESLEKINRRLDKIESQIAFQNSNPQSEIRNPKSNHPSQERFLNLEEIADAVIKDLPNEKACPYEPTGKPCDHCSMCSSRGF